MTGKMVHQERLRNNSYTMAGDRTTQTSRQMIQSTDEDTKTDDKRTDRHQNK